VPRQEHYYGLNHLHFLTTSTYRRARVFDSERFRRHFVKTLADLRVELGFHVVGYVLMPEHFHLLIWPWEQAHPSQIMQRLKEHTAQFILKNLRRNRQYAWCAKMLTRLKLPPTVHDEAHYRVWQRRFYDPNVWSDKKRLEKLNYMHNNRVKRGLVSQPSDWPWSSWRFYFLNDASMLAMDRVP
jgi:putative transposase